MLPNVQAMFVHDDLSIGEANLVGPRFFRSLYSTVVVTAQDGRQTPGR